jgi:hypothetical protein
MDKEEELKSSLNGLERVNIDSAIPFGMLTAAAIGWDGAML